MNPSCFWHPKNPKINRNFLWIFMIVVVFSNLAYAEVCCEKDTNNNYCMFVDASQCASSSLRASIGCEQTSFCKLGCCYNSGDGTCFKNVGKAQCLSQGGSWDSNNNCEIEQCNKGCCIIGAEGFFVTEVQCKNETSKYPDVTMEFRQDVLSEKECVDVARSQEEGCCVSDDGCSFVTRGECNIQSSGNATGNGSKSGFYKDRLCSNDELGCDCARQHNTGCVEGKDEVYWFDSCGNKENIYSTNKVSSYNNGYILEKEDSCSLSGAEDISCGNCNYDTGTICGKNIDENIGDSLFGDYICRDVNCDEVFRDDASPNSGGNKNNGESWCIYDTAVGHGRDVVGSRHYRHICVNGEEFVEPCMDFRDEICIQGKLGEDPTGTYEAFGISGDYIEAACRKNRWEDCVGIAEKKACESVAYRDCYWVNFGIIPVGEGDKVGVCIPEVPPGLKFWTDDRVNIISSSTRDSGSRTPVRGDISTAGNSASSTSSSAGSSSGASSTSSTLSSSSSSASTSSGSNSATGAAVTTQGTEALGGISSTTGRTSAVCEQGSFECVAVFKIKGGDVMFGNDEWECEHNCHCTEKNWIVATNNYCKSLGDCGAYYNIEGKSTMDGFTNIVSNEKRGTLHKLTSADLNDWNSLSNPSKGDYDEPGFFNELGKDGRWVGPAAIGAGGILTGVASIGGAGFGAGFTVGATSGLSTIGGWFGGLGKLFGAKGGTAAKSVPKVVAPQAGAFMGFVNTIAWIYTVYSILDIVLTDYKEVTYTIGCGLWVAPEGGQDCEECNDNNKPCSLYRCKSLGQLCSLVNEGTNEEKCVNIHPNDVSSPIITPDEDALTEDYTLEETTIESNKGFEIVERIEPFSMVTFGIETDEVSQCKFSKSPGKKYSEMEFFFGEQVYDYQHGISFSFPRELTSREALSLTNGGEYMLYLRCKDASGNVNDRDYFIKFNMKPSPDLTAPVIEDTSIENNGYLKSGVNKTELILFLNEPSSCKWDRNDKEYQFMTNEFMCDNSGIARAMDYYRCKTDLANLTDDNIFYFKCRDIKGNTNVESYEFRLYGTDPLYITSSGPSGILYVQSVELKAITEEGAEDGKAKCGYSEQEVAYENMIEFLETGDISHKQPLNLIKDVYNYSIKCRDIAGNEDTTTIAFEIDVDNNPPNIVYVYKEGGNLYLEMDEVSSCKYSTNLTFFSYDNGLSMTRDNSYIHEVQLIGNMFNVKCRDEFDNEGSYKIYV